MPKSKHKQPRIVFFGHFGAGNFGNEATLQAILLNIGRFIPGAELMCVTSFPVKVAQEYGIAAIPISEVVVKPWNLRNPVVRFGRKLLVGIPSEISRWFGVFKTLWNASMFIIVGTGLLTDSFSLGGWGPYSVFKWSLVAKLCRCKILFVSAGAGPLDRAIGRFLTKSALSLADFRSYRDQATLEYLKGIGFRRYNDRVFPDLAFSLPPAVLPDVRPNNGRRRVVGLGLMDFGGLYGIEKTTRAQYSAYFETLAGFVKWLLDRDYDVRILIGALSDEPAVREFKFLLKRRSVPEDQVIVDPISSTKDLLYQLAATDFIVATRFHNVVLALFLDKPCISISFHHKCSSLMQQMGLGEYCQDIQRLNAEKLMEQFGQLERNSESVKQTIRAKVADCRKALDEQYGLIFKDSLAL